MTTGLSAYLDFLRVVAALVVFGTHLSGDRFSGGAVGFPVAVGHSAVMVFFVLSGYVIAWSTTAQRQDLRTYFVHRAARIYSVALPAILLTNLVDLSLTHWAAMPADGVPAYQYWHYPEYLGLASVFGGEAWFLNETAFSDVPYWSLTYEVAYYALFGAVVFTGGWRRCVAILGVLLLTGPRPWLLFPLWAMGAALALAHLHRQPAPIFRIETARLLVAATAIGAIAVAWFRTDGATDQWSASILGGTHQAQAWLHYARFAPTDWLIGILIAVNIAAARDARLVWPRAGARLVRWAASFTFALYLSHYPLLEFWVGHFDPPWPILVILVLVSVWMFGLVTERQKHRWRALFARVTQWAIA
jgi:peptidoglycan/LPS O-acetylase OafA/YrhL